VMSTYGTIKLFVVTRTPIQVMHFITSISNKLKSAMKFTCNSYEILTHMWGGENVIIFGQCTRAQQSGELWCERHKKITIK